MIEILSAEQLEALYEGLDKLDARLDDERLSPRAQTALVDTILHGQRFAAVAAERLGDVRFLQRLTRGLEAIGEFERSTFATHTVSEILGRLLRQAPIGPAVEQLARSPSRLVRVAVATGIGARGPEARAVLRGLAAHPARSVRVAARQALGAEILPPWLGVLSADPSTLVDPATLAASRATLDTVLSWANAPSRGDHVVHPDVADLPEPLAVDIVERLLGDADDYELRTEAPGLLAALLRWPSGVPAIWRVWSADRGDRRRWAHEAVAQHALTGLDPAVAVERALALVARLGKEAGAPEGVVSCVVSAVEHGWPASADPRRLFDALTALGDLPASSRGDVRSRLATGLVKAADVTIAEEVLTSLAAGDVTLAGRFGAAFRSIVAVLPLARRLSGARQALQHAATATWAITSLVEADAVTPEEGAAWLRDPSLREHVVNHHPEAVLDLLRAELRAGSLSDDEVAILSHHVGDDEDMWTVIRRRRAAAPHELALCLPPGAWTDDDRAHVDRLLTEVERPSGGEEPDFAFGLAFLLMSRTDEPEAALRSQATLSPEDRKRIEVLVDGGYARMRARRAKARG